MLLTFASGFGVLLPYYTRLLRLRALSSRKLLVKRRYSFEARFSFVFRCPSAKQDIGFLSYIRIYCIVSGQDTKSLQEGLICKRLLESCTSILNQCIQYDKSTYLAVRIAIFAVVVSEPSISQGNSELTASCAKLELLPLVQMLGCG